MSGTMRSGGRDETAEGGTAEGAAHGDFETFFARSLPGMLARAMLLCGHPQDAEDAVQEAYAEALRRWDRLRGYDAPDAWVYRVVRQRLWGAARSRRRTRPVDDPVAEMRPPAAASVEQTAEVRAVLAALSGLPARQRTVLVLHCLQGLPQDEIAGELGLSRGGVAANLHKARRRLKGVVGTADEGTVPGRRRPVQHDRGELVPAGAGGTARPDEPADGVAAALLRAELWLRGGLTRAPGFTRRLRAPGVTAHPGVPDVPGAPQAPGTTEIPGTAGAPGEPSR
ncbi:RNA polymerase sigma factor [Streptomyces sp. JJ36]|uniref:RNA polymerase sigma factor n=1 Tax=Streptomyces sp. JJ36 TaxID=2736645 RepID=UPI001F46FB53|nr:sigma-70 family RNA polymerase sigma factor [Streptomyces sp. JJ36]MCF6522830.1 sigma-70 family RNA polymerase sigma factor [Streptomyces sp. JJ36]